MLFPKSKRHEDREFLNNFHSKRCVVCNKYGADPDHVLTKKRGGPDLPHNICPLCRHHHQEKGNKGISHMAGKYIFYRNWLISNGWYYCEVRMKWVNDLNNGI